MIKISYEQKPYYYEHTGSQPYNIKTEMELNEDISGTEAILAFIRVLRTATYPITLGTLKNLVKELEFEYDDNDYLDVI